MFVRTSASVMYIVCTRRVHKMQVVSAYPFAATRDQQDGFWLNLTGTI